MKFNGPKWSLFNITKTNMNLSKGTQTKINNKNSMLP